MREVLETNRVRFVRAAAGDSYATITAEMGKLDFGNSGCDHDRSVGDSILKGRLCIYSKKKPCTGW